MTVSNGVMLWASKSDRPVKVAMRVVTSNSACKSNWPW